MKTFHCESCDQVLFFENTTCVGCGATVGFAPDVLEMHAYGEGTRYRACRNYVDAQVCNWLMPVDAPGELCRSCELTAVIPDLDQPGHHEQWFRMEAAKRRLIYTLLELELPLVTRAQDPEGGLEFHFKSEQGLPPGEAVMTGHDNGIITVNLAEADDAERERRRIQMHEPYRTLLGHFRHEIGHYYWDRLVLGTKWQEAFRELFGDERSDYAAALRANYEVGPRPDWQLFHVSGYASSHPWEDWAETWAQYLHMIDIVDTALSFGLDTAHVEIESEPFDTSTLWRQDVPDAHDFLHFLNTWVQLTHMLNEMSRSMGQSDFYPFVLPRAAVAKLQLIHMVVSDAPFPGVPSDAVAQAPASPQPPTREPLPETMAQQPQAF